MPYIDKTKRVRFDVGLDNLLDKDTKKGELTYCVYKLATQYIQQKGLNYQNSSDACAALADAEFEVRRRVMSLYEDFKIKQNGDVEP